MPKSSAWTDEALEQERIALCQRFVSDGWILVPLSDGDLDVFIGQDSGLVRTSNLFYQDLYGFHESTDSSSKFGSGIVLNHPAVTNKAHYEKAETYDALKDGTVNEETFLYCGKFWLPKNGYISTEGSFQASLCSFVVDIDRDPDFHFMGDALAETLGEMFPENPLMKPRYITLTGTGIQLWYLFGKDIELYSKKNPRRMRYGRLVQALYEWWDEHLPGNQGKVDMRCASINHAFRAPGSPTKQGYQTWLLRRGDDPDAFLDLPALVDLLGIRFNEWDFHPQLTDADIEQIEAAKVEREGAPATERQLDYINHLHEVGAIADDAFASAERASISKADEIIKGGEASLTRRRNYKSDHGVVSIHGGAEVPKKPRHRKLYEYVLRRIPEDTPTGTRYFALCALAGYAYNCDVPLDELEADMMALLDSRMAKGKSARDNKPLELRDVKAALKAYKPLGAVTRRETAEEWLGWSFGAPAKRNGRKQSEHLAKVARPIRKAFLEAGRDDVSGGGRPTKEEEIRAYAADHPQATQRQIADALDVSKTTVNKWLKKR